MMNAGVDEGISEGSGGLWAADIMEPEHSAGEDGLSGYLNKGVR